MSIRERLILTISIALLPQLHPLLAQDPVAWVRSEARDQPGGEGALASARPEVTLGVTEEGSNLSAIFGMEFGTSLRHALEVKVTGQLESGQQELELANRSDLPGDIQASLTFTGALTGGGDALEQCREINELLGAQVPAGPRLPKTKDGEEDPCAGVPPCDREDECIRTVGDAWARLQCGLDADSIDISGKARFEAYRGFWEDFFRVWKRREAQLKAIPEAQRSGRESFELATLVSFDLPEILEIEEEVERDLCGKWNKDRFGNLLLDQVPGPTEGTVEKRLEEISEVCTVDSLIERRKADETQKAIRTARNTHSVKVAEAEDTHEREKHAANLIADPTERAKALRAAKDKRDAALETAKKNLENATDLLAMAALWKKTADGVYEELAGAMAKEIARWNGAAAPFIVPRPGEVVASIACGQDDIDAALAAAPGDLEWRMRREIERLVPGQLFLTASFANSSADFTFAKPDRSTNTMTGLIDTTRENEHNYSGRVGFSYLRSGSLWTAGAGRRRVWRAAPNVEFCVDAAESDALLCTSTGLAAPTQTDSSVYDVRWSRRFSPRFAIQAQIAFEDEMDVLNPQVVFFFLPQGENLRGGISLSYVQGAEDATEGFNARLFIGVPFSLDVPGQ